MSDPKRVYKTQLHEGEFRFARTPEDPRQRQDTYAVQFTGSLLHETWIPEYGPVSHNGATGALIMSLEFADGLVNTPATVARSLRALADHLETLK